MLTRLAEANDIAALLALDEEIATLDAVEGFPERVIETPGLPEWFLERGGILLALDDDRIVGYLLGRVAGWMHGNRSVVCLEHITVHPHFRRRGIATRLLEFAREHYRGSADCLHASIHPKNAASLALLRRLPAEESERVLVYIHLQHPGR